MNDMIFVSEDTGKFSTRTQHKTKNYFVVHMRTWPLYYGDALYHMVTLPTADLETGSLVSKELIVSDSMQHFIPTGNKGL
jgi:hypothetical protein